MRNRRFNSAPTRLARRAVPALAASIALLAVAAPTEAYDWKLLRPSNSGIPGEQIRFLDFTPDGRLWVGARWIFWQEGGVGIYDRTSRAWTVWADWQTPIPTEMVNDVAFGPGGVVWIATDQGLVKKDGDAWTVYTHANSPLLHDEIRQIALDSQGHVWINNTEPTSQNAAIFEFTGTTWRQWGVPTIPWADPWRQLDGLVVDHNDHVWVGNWTLGGVAEWNGTKWTLHGGSMDVMVPAAVDAENNIWLIHGHLGYVVYKWNGTSFVAWGGGMPPLPTTTNTVVAVDGGSVYIGNWTGQIAKTTSGGARWTLFNGNIGARIVDMAFDPLSSDVWIGTPAYVHRYSEAGVRQNSLNSFNTGFPDFFVDALDFDRDGNAWVATGEGGLSRFDGQRWRNWGAHNAGAEPYPFAENEPMSCAFHAADGSIWMGGNGIARWDPATGTFTGFWNHANNPGMGVGLFTEIVQDGNGALFAVEKYGEVFRFDGSQWIRQPAVTPAASMGTACMVRDRHGNVWVAEELALYRWDGTSWAAVGESLPLFDLGGVLSMAIGPDDTIWLGTVGGLLRWNGAGVSTLFTTLNSPLPANPVHGLAVRDDGLLAVAASEYRSTVPFPCGLCIVNGDPALPSHWTVYGWGTSPLPHYQLGQVAFDPSGNLWVVPMSQGVAIVMTGSGVTAVDPGAGTVPAQLALRVSGPNPLRVGRGTDLDFVLPGAGDVARLEIFNVAGQRVRVLVDGPRPGGEGHVHWDGRGEQGERLPAGIYLARIAVGSANRSLKLALVN